VRSASFPQGHRSETAKPKIGPSAEAPPALDVGNFHALLRELHAAAKADTDGVVEWLGFDNERSVRAKLDLARAYMYGVRSAMLWSRGSGSTT
jgi:hypothetical protein